MASYVRRHPLTEEQKTALASLAAMPETPDRMAAICRELSLPLFRVQRYFRGTPINNEDARAIDLWLSRRGLPRINLHGVRPNRRKARGPVCPTCNGTGVYHVGRPEGDDTERSS